MRYNFSIKLDLPKNISNNCIDIYSLNYILFISLYNKNVYS